jgi:hypothetical protein
VQKVTCGLAEWQTENADVLALPYSSYSINGISATLGGGTVKTINGVMIPQHLYADLAKTGLCFPGV